MSNPPLYSVDGAGVVEETTPPVTRKPSTKPRPTEPLPSDRMKWATAESAVRAYCTLSRGGTVAVSADQLGTNLSIASTTAPLNNTFFLSLGLIQRAGKGEFTPTEIALAYSQKYSFDKEGAPRLLAPAFAESWFFRAVQQRLEITPDATRSQILETLAGVSGVDATFSAQLGQLLEWLKYVGLIVIDGDRVLIADEAPDSSKDDEVIAGLVDEVLDGIPTTPASPQRARTTTHPAAKPPLISLSLEITLTTEEASILSTEQINALFAGVGQIVAVKARLEEN